MMHKRHQPAGVGSRGGSEESSTHLSLRLEAIGDKLFDREKINVRRAVLD